jgi:hypothetical protein
MQPTRLWLISLILVGALPGHSLWAQSLSPLEHRSRSLASSGRSLITAGQRSRYLPLLPYPYPRIHVTPYLSLDLYASPEAYAPCHPPAATSQGFLRLEVKPPEAEIFVDGTFIGRGEIFPGLHWSRYGKVAI